ncbi:AGE family epimerase/isomerase [Neptunicella sp. SCSIO 80796]|uniref:AGE family epimerase/isomerase n=1 Tax=Neptunicella plasticusilytica TaxID=3117012 RepID=UPI003A4D74B1
MAISANLLKATSQFRTWMINHALPLWSTTGIEQSSAGSHERLLASGEPDLESTKRARVQCRQLFVFASAAEMGWLVNAEQVVEGINHFLQQHAARTDIPGMYAHLLDPQNKVIDKQQDLYDIAFFLLAAAYRYRVTNKPDALQQANQLTAHIESTLKKAPGGWMEGDYPAKERRQNPHMHLFEAFLALYDTTRDGKWLAKAGEIFCLFETCFFDHQHHVLREFFQDDWQPSPGQRGNIVEPGHMMEWVWLLRKYQQFSDTPVDSYCHHLHHNALALGQDKSTGLLFDEITPTGEVLSATKRCWTLTELLKANLAQATAGHVECEEGAAQAIELLFKYYLSEQVEGSYIDQLDADNNVVMELAPASTLYHLMLACTEAVKYCESNDH